MLAGQRRLAIRRAAGAEAPDRTGRERRRPEDALRIEPQPSG